MTILLIEDNHLFSELIELSLNEVDLHVVNTLGTAQEWLGSFKADLILVDLGLPDSQGLNTLKQLAFSRIPKIVLTAADECPDKAAQLGAVDYIRKADTKAMLERIRFHIKRIDKPRMHFAPEVFEQLKVCLTLPKIDLPQLTHAH